MKLHRKLIITASIAIALGVASIAPVAYFWNQNRLAAANPANSVMIPVEAPLPAPTPTLITGKPVQINIPSLGITLAVQDGVFNEKSKTWTLSKDQAHYALPTVQPNNESGNTLIYGHYKKGVFASLHKITVGTEAQVITDNGYRFTYTFRQTQTVDPSNVDIFAYEGAPQLTVQTCSGTWMQNRQFYFFDFKSVEKL